MRDSHQSNHKHKTHTNSVLYSVLYLEEPQILVVFADHLQLVIETVGHDHVAHIVHHQRIEAMKFQILPAFLSKKAGGFLVYDIDTIKTTI